MAIPLSDNGGNGSGGFDAAGNPNSTNAQGILALVQAPEGVYISRYQEWDEQDYAEVY
jgi:hypothetical protein